VIKLLAQRTRPITKIQSMISSCQPSNRLPAITCPRIAYTEGAPAPALVTPESGLDHPPMEPAAMTQGTRSASLIPFSDFQESPAVLATTKFELVINQSDNFRILSLAQWLAAKPTKA
jgi:hypothetical protein